MPVARKLALVALAYLACVAGARADSLPARVDVRADSVAFYPYANSPLLAANGHVVVHYAKRTIAGDTLRWDLQKNLVTVTGDVQVSGGGADVNAVAYHRDLASGETYVMRVDPIPATYAVRNDEMASAVERSAPAGTFDAIDLDGQRPYMRGRHAIVTPNAGVRMTPVEFPTGAGPALKLPTYLYTLVQNQYINTSAAPGASFYQPFPLFGSPASLASAHLRYDSYNGVTEALDERLVDRDRAYLVASVLPFRDKQFDLLSYQVIRPGLQQTFGATHTFGAYSTNIVSYKLSQSEKLLQEAVQFNAFDASNSAEFDLSTYEHDIKHLFGYQLRGSYGYDHNFGGYPYSNAYRIGADVLLLAPSFKLLGANVNAKYEYAVTKYDFPHEITTATATLSAGRQFGPRVNVYAQAQLQQSDNRYGDPAVGHVALGLPAPGSPFVTSDGTPFPGLYAYTGLNTYRSYFVQTTVNGHGDNHVQLAFYYNDAFPQFHGYGPAPYFASIDIVQRITPVLKVELSRGYSFGWNHQYLSPQYGFAISP